MAKIKRIHATEILDSKGSPTIETTVILSDGKEGIAACPSGTSVGSYEASELRDQDSNRYSGKGVLKAIENIHSIIAPKLLGIDVSKQQDIDKIMIELDGTQNKSQLGANAILSVSMAACKAAANSSVLPLFLYLRQFIKKETAPLRIPTPLFNVINGGAHAGWNLDFQEFIVIPASSKPFSESLQIGYTIYYSLKNKLKMNNYTTLVGDEGGFGPRFQSNVEAFKFLAEAIDATPYKIGFDVFFGMDAASNGFFKDKSYHVRDKANGYSPGELIEFYKELNKQFHPLYLEDPISEDDWDNWTKIVSEVGGDTIITGDDLTVTNPYRLQMAINKKAITGIIIKPNQIGTVIESIAVAEVARAAGIKIIVSHRSGETNDDFIADLAVALSADYCKFGAPARGERLAKYNRLIHIDNQIKSIGNQQQ